MVRRSRFVPVVILALLGSLLVVGRAEAASAGVVVQAGALHPTNEEAPFEYIQFYPSALRVHQGQVVRWKILGFHTITFAKAGVRPPFFRTDEIPGTHAVDERWAFGATDCGHGEQKPCSLTKGTRYLSSGAPFFSGDPFAVKMDVPPGKYAYQCNVHTKMAGTIDVVGKSAPVPTQKQINTQVASAVAKDTKAADALFKADQRPLSKVGADGQRIWRVLTGDATADNHVQIIGYLPNNLEIAAGDKVEFGYRKGFLGDFHTVTFPTELSGGFTEPVPAPYGLAGLGIYFSCDPDEPNGGAPGVPGLWEVLTPCPGTFELGIAPWMTEGHAAPGDAVLTPVTYHDSGSIVAAGHPDGFRKLPDGTTLPTGFDAEFPAPGAFTFECNIHFDFMTGSINVV